ncbi:hypothetical protein N7451_001338 [Penicillium sp. IBT 35674x]|nr:hypothetical protein N7451_001338 [Penicillium sp. IBT 35674x]
MDKFKKWRKQRKPITYVPETPDPTTEVSAPPRYQTDPSPLPVPTSAFKFGLKTVHECSDAVVDICFVHGLTGDRDKTWTAVGQTTPWPKILLPPRLNARVLMYGYDANVARKSVVSSNRLINHAQNLLGDLTADRVFCNASSRPLIFVAHSLGGLVCKKTVLLSQNAAEPQSRALFDCLEGIAFMGTPHKGAWMADWAKIPASVFGLVKSTNVMLLDILQRDNQLLDSIQVDFLTMIRRIRESGRAIGIACFFEELPFPVIGKIVTEESATLDGYDNYSIYGNHRDMVRFRSEEDPGFKRLLWKLLTWTSQVGDKTKEDYTLAAEDRACLRDLQTTNPRDDKSRIEATKGGLLRDSYNWALEDKNFLDWHYREKGGGILWVRGDPGKGKTMLLCGIIDEISKLNPGSISFFFCQATDTRLNYATAVLRGLIYMMIEQDPSLISHVRQRYDESGKQLFENPNAWHALSAIFVEMLQHSEEPCLIIDALDECTTGLSSLLELIVKVSSTHPHVKWIVSSRNWPQIKEHMSMIPENKRMALEMNESSVSEAVKIFIHDRVQHLAKLKRYSQQIFDAVYSYLLLNAQGTFLWVALVCERLASIPRLRTIEKLTAFPPGLDALYERMMQQVCEHEEAPLCKDILGLISTTYRPITIDELTAFIELPEYVLEDGYESLEEIIGYCGSFLTVSENTIFFVHQSAKDYLLEKAKVEILPDGMAGKHIFILENSLAIMDKKLRRNILSLRKIDGSINPVLNLWSHDGMNLIHSNWLSNTIDILDPVSWESTATIETEEGIHIRCLALSHNGKLLASGSKESLIEVWDLTMRKRVSTLEGHSESIYAMAWLRDGRLVSASSDKTIKIWDPFARQCLSILKGHHSPVDFLLLSADEKRLISASDGDSVIKIWDLNSSTAVRDHTQPVRSVVWSNDAKCFASYSDTEIRVWNPSTAACLFSTESHGGTIGKICWSHNGDLASLSSDGTLRIWDLSTGRCSMQIESVEPSASLTWSQDGSNFILASYDGLIKTWDAKIGQQLSTLKVDNIGFFVTWSHDATRFASIADNWSIMIQSPYTGRCVLHLEGHQDPEVDEIPLFLRRPVIMCWSRDGTKLASALGPTIKIWDLKTGQCTMVLEIEQNPRDFHFHFPRGPMFEESDPEYLHTKVGSFNIEPHVNAASDATASLVCSPQQVGFGLSECGSWITYNGVNMLALPFDYGPSCSSAMAVSGSTVALGCVTGRIMILKFSKDMSLAQY